jgi:DNA-directed RNA polymerase specialized sigma24 family protein
VTDVHEIRHGYTFADLDRIAIAAARARLHAYPFHERRDIAWSAIAEHLCAAAERPAETDLLQAGRRALERWLRSDLRHHGISERTLAPMPRHAAYWETLARPTAGPEDRAVERVALHQILALLPHTQRAALDALADCGTFIDAADALGLKYKALANRIDRARRSFLAHWHEGETPSKVWRIERPGHRGNTYALNPAKGAP